MSDSPHPTRLAGTHWDPAQYLRFADHRLRPALELAARVPLEEADLVYDLGCGTGEVTRRLAARWPRARVIGVDHSAEMIDAARAAAVAHPADPTANPTGNVAQGSGDFGGRSPEWQLASVETWKPEAAPDLIYSNATLHWVDDHASLFPRLLGELRAGGCLAVQMPMSWELPSHRLMRDTLQNGGPAGRALGSAELRAAVGRRWVHDPADYHRMLATCTATLDIWETEYLQELDGDDAVLEWVRGTGLRPILHGLDDAERTLFLAAYAARLREAYPKNARGRTLFPFRRLFLVAGV